MFDIDKEEIIRKVQDIVIRPDMNPQEINEVLAKLDALYTEVELKFANIKRLANEVDLKYKLAQKEAYLHVNGKNEKEREALITQFLNEHLCDIPEFVDMTYPEAKLYLDDLMTFYEAVIDTLKFKLRIMILYMSSQKIDAALIDYRNMDLLTTV